MSIIDDPFGEIERLKAQLADAEKLGAELVESRKEADEYANLLKQTQKDCAAWEKTNADLLQAQQQTVRDRDALQAKLDCAVKALEWISYDFDPDKGELGPLCGPEGLKVIKEALAKIKEGGRPDTTMLRQYREALEDINAGKGDPLPGGSVASSATALMRRAERALTERACVCMAIGADGWRKDVNPECPIHAEKDYLEDSDNKALDHEHAAKDDTR